MKLLIKIILIISVIYLNNLSAQNKKLNPHGDKNIDCRQCHVCDTPTKSDPCLILCPRYKMETVRHSPEDGPDLIIMDEFKEITDLYDPVNFSHKLHSEMSLMSGGCSICHHYNPPGKIVKCSYCHEPDRIRTDISKPDLKAAYHRQCINCHSSWEENVECRSCHESKGTETKSVSKEPIKTEGHPELIIPTKLIYETDTDEGKLVTFFHNEHTALFNLECTDCHSSESCAKCHNKKVSASSLVQDDTHERCLDCHDTEDNCSKCHNDNETKPFNHSVAAGFNINKYHSDFSCISCHKTSKKFSGLNGNCISCHSWDIDNFDHKVTGLVLDETHSEFDCEDCHEDKNFNIKPNCIACHEDEIVYPTNLPGKRIK